MRTLSQRRRFAFYLFLLLAGAAWFFSAHFDVSAQQPTPSDDDVNAIARQLYCTVCENTPLDVCPTQACHDWRELIRQMLAEGKTPEQIKQYFVVHFGARVLSEPPRTGLNWLVYVVLSLILLAGAYFLFRELQTWRSSANESVKSSTSGSASSVEDKYVARLEDELRKRK